MKNKWVTNNYGEQWKSIMGEDVGRGKKRGDDGKREKVGEDIGR